MQAEIARGRVQGHYVERVAADVKSTVSVMDPRAELDRQEAVLGSCSIEEIDLLMQARDILDRAEERHNTLSNPDRNEDQRGNAAAKLSAGMQ